MATIFAYLDYRKLLRDILAEKKRQDPRFSQRFVHRKMGVPVSSGFIANVVAGKKNLTDEQVLRLARLLKLSGPETAFLENLVRYNQSDSIDDKNDFLRRLIPEQKNRLQKLHPDQMSIFSKWHYVYLRELLAFFPIKDNFAEAGRMLSPALRPLEVRKTLAALEKMGLAVKDENGFYCQRDSLLTTGDETASVYLAHFQMHTMDLAKQALQAMAPEERDISVVACALSAGGFRRVKETIQACRKQILNIAREDRDLERVYQCNFQFFPVSIKRKTHHGAASR